MQNGWVPQCLSLSRSSIQKSLVFGKAALLTKQAFKNVKNTRNSFIRAPFIFLLLALNFQFKKLPDKMNSKFLLVLVAVAALVDVGANGKTKAVIP